MMKVKWENMEMVMMQAGGLLLTRRSGTLRRAKGAKLKVLQRWDPYLSTSPVSASDYYNTSPVMLKITDYAGDMIYENGTLKRILIDGGYIEDGQYYYYLIDHLGNNRLVVNSGGTVVQKNHYYPFGMSFAETSVAEQGKQPYKFGGKELDMMNGLNQYDYSARYYDPAIARFTTMDPMAEKYPDTSPYVYCGNNPVNAVDPTGKTIIFTVNSNKFLFDKRGLTVYGTGGKVTYPDDSHLARVVNAYLKALNCNDSEISGKVQDLINSPHNHYIEGLPAGKSKVEGGAPELTVSEGDALIKEGKGVGTQTQFDFSEEGREDFERTEGVSNSDFTTVTHELQHQYDYDKGNMAKDQDTTSSAKDPSEIRAVNLENRARKIEKLKQRTKYGGEDIDPKKLKKQ